MTHQRKSPEQRPVAPAAGGSRTGLSAFAATPRVEAQRVQLKRMFGSRVMTKAPRAGGVLQRVLGHTQPIVAADVVAVKQLGGKLVFRLTGNHGDAVIVKFETHGGAETTAEAGSRNEMIQTLAEQVLKNVPGMSPLSNADIQEIQRLLPNAVGPDVALLQTIVGDAQAKADMLFLKKEKLDVGVNLMDMIKKELKAPVKMVKLKQGQGILDALPKSQQLLLNPGILGKWGAPPHSTCS